MTFLDSALELAERGRGTARPNPVVGAVVVRGDRVVGEGWHERKGGPHAEVVALAQAGELARGATLYVTMEPCAHHGTTPPCVDAVAAAGIVRVVAASLDPHPGHGGGLERLRGAGIETELAEGELAFRARRQNEAWRTWAAEGRPFVVYKVAVTLDGRVSVPGRRWITGAESRRRVHELRARVDAVAVGMGTARADDPQLTARDVGAKRQPRRLVFGQGPLPPGSELELRTGPLERELRSLAEEGVQALLLEGGPTLASAFLAAGFVDKLQVYVAPTIAGTGVAGLAGSLPHVLRATRLRSERVGEDVLLEAYLHDP